MSSSLSSSEILREAGFDPNNLSYEQSALRGAGFSGFVPFAKLTADSPAPVEGGVYVVLYNSAEMIEFIHPSLAGWFNEEDPTSPESKLQANWVPHAPVVYIGKGTSLRVRLRQFAQFGAGKAIGHRGGKLIWQLPNPDSMIVAWKVTPEHDPEVVEAAMLRHFFCRHGMPPFANDPDKMGQLKSSRFCNE